MTYPVVIVQLEVKGGITMKIKNVVAILSVLALMTALAAWASETYTPPPESVKPPRVTVISIYQTKCSKCHAISRPDGVEKDPAGWKDTVTRMQGKDPAWISKDEADKITQLLAGRSLCKVKCVKCHTAERINTQKTQVQWISSVDRMQSKDPSWISDVEKKLILFYLTDVNLLDVDY